MTRAIELERLTPEHIKYILGVELPLLHEAVGITKQREIVLKQYLFEIWYYDLIATAGGLLEESSGLFDRQNEILYEQIGQYLRSAGQAISSGYDKLQAAASRLQSVKAKAAKYGLAPQAIKTSIQQKFTGTINNVKSFAQALTLLFQHPTLVDELKMELSGEITRMSSPLLQFVVELRDKLVQTENETVKNSKLYNPLLQTTEFVLSSLNNLLEKYRVLKGWVSVVVGLVIYPLIKNIIGVYDKAINTTKTTLIAKTLGVKLVAAKTAALAYGSKKAEEKIDPNTGNQDVQSLEEEIDFKNLFKRAGQAAEKETAGTIKATVDSQLNNAFNLLSELAKKLSKKAVDFIVTKAATMGILGYFGTAATLVGGFAIIANIAAPIVTKFIAKYNQIVAKEAEGRTARTAGMGGALSQQVPTSQKIAMSKPVQTLQRFGQSIGLEENKIRLTDIIYN